MTTVYFSGNVWQNSKDSERVFLDKEPFEVDEPTDTDPAILFLKVEKFLREKSNVVHISRTAGITLDGSQYPGCQA